MKKLLSYFTFGEILLWSLSIGISVLSFFIFGSRDILSLIASLVGITSLIFNAKGNPVGQVLMVVFSILYGVISYSFSYYGEMLTYLGMTMPMSVFALITWLKNPYEGKRSQVAVNRVGKRDVISLTVLTVVVTFVFCFILKYFNTANMIPSTVSVATSFAAVYLTYKRSPWYAIAYAANDMVLITLWLLASLSDIRYMSVVICFIAFLINDIYGFISWKCAERVQLGETMS